MTETEILNVFLDTRALLRGHFELRSKLHSDQYFQCAHVLMYPRHAQRLCSELVAQCARARPVILECDAVISPAMGGLIVGHEVGRALDRKAVFAEKLDGNLAMRRFAIERGARYLVAEDVLTRGGRILETIRLVEAAGASVSGVLVIVDRSGGKASLGYPVESLLRMTPTVWEPAACPLCAKGVPAVHPGS